MLAVVERFGQNGSEDHNYLPAFLVYTNDGNDALFLIIIDVTGVCKKESNMETVQQVRDKILPILKKYAVTKAGLFGSLVRSELNAASDIDVLVEIADNLSLLDVVGLKLELEEALQRKVDLVEYCTIKPALQDVILQEEVAIL